MCGGFTAQIMNNDVFDCISMFRGSLEVGPCQKSQVQQYHSYVFGGMEGHKC
jgi:hypothetical protein